MGVRIALGAGPAAIVRLVMGESGWLVVIGIALGGVVTFGLAR
jgi:ABC-type antimicrobial peptide transport system permease subunit